MAWSLKSVNGCLVATETVTGVASGTAYTSEISFIKKTDLANHYVGISCANASLAGTNLDVSLLGTATSGTAGASMEFTHVSDSLVADITTGTTKSANVDFNLYPTPFYRIGFLVDSSETAKSVTVTIVVP